MTDDELNVLERIWKGETSLGAEWEAALNALEANGYIEIIGRPDARRTGLHSYDTFLVRITDEGSAHLSSSAY